MIEISVTNRVRIWLGGSATSVVDPLIVDAVKKRFTYQNPAGRDVPLPPFARRTWKVEKDEGGHWLTLPRGALQRVRVLLKELGHPWLIKDLRTTGDPELAGQIPPLRRPLWSYQAEAQEKAIARQNCLVRAPTGSGKTTAAFAIASAVNLGTLIVVDDGGLFKQWVRRCVDELGMRPDRVGKVKGPAKSWKVGPITIASSATLYQHPEFYEQHGHRFGLVIADEVQGFAAKTMFAAIDPLPAKYRVGISADESRKDQMEFLIYDLFGSVACDIPMQRVIASGNVLDVLIRVVPTNFSAPWYQLAVRHGSDRERREAWNKLIDEMSTDDARNVLAATLVQAETAKGLHVIVWSHRVDHCRALDNMLASYGVMSGLMLGGAGQSTEFERTREGLVSGMLDAGVGTVEAIGQAIDIPLAARGVITTPVATNRQRFNQIRGRICRAAKDKGKVDAELIYLWDRLVHGRKHIENLVSWYGQQVVVQEGLEWVPAQRWLKENKRDQRGAAPQNDFEGIFTGGTDGDH